MGSVPADVRARWADSRHKASVMENRIVGHPELIHNVWEMQPGYVTVANDANAWSIGRHYVYDTVLVETLFFMVNTGSIDVGDVPSIQNLMNTVSTQAGHVAYEVPHQYSGTVDSLIARILPVVLYCYFGIGDSPAPPRFTKKDYEGFSEILRYDWKFPGGYDSWDYDIVKNAWVQHVRPASPVTQPIKPQPQPKDITIPPAIVVPPVGDVGQFALGEWALQQEGVLGTQFLMNQWTMAHGEWDDAKKPVDNPGNPSVGDVGQYTLGKWALQQEGLLVNRSLAKGADVPQEKKNTVSGMVFAIGLATVLALARLF